MPSAASTTSTAQSTRLRVWRVRRMRSSPRAPSSSKPGVSMMTTGPRGSSSMALRTGSVVVPRTSETTDSSWPVTTLTRLDLPAFRRPKKPMCTRSADGVSFSPMARPQKRKSRCPWTIFSSRSAQMARTLSLGMLASSAWITFSPRARVSGEA